MKKNIIFLIAIFVTGSIVTSCNKKFLDVSKELAEEQTLEKIFSNPAETRRFHTHIYTGIPNTLYMWWHYYTGLDNPWPLLADELRLHSSGFVIQVNGIPMTDTQIGRWVPLYKLIRQANIFLERVQVIPREGVADYLSESEVAEKKAIARFLRAYYHYLLLEQYGPIPIMDHVVDPAETNIDFARNSVDEVVDFVYNELTGVADQLKDPDLADVQFMAVPTKGVALAVRAKLLVYAASPLLNGGYTEALAVVNPDGKRIFPDRDPSKWNRALTAMQEFIDYAAIHYELYKEYTGGVLDPDKSVYGVNMKMNKEIIFANSTPWYHDQPSASWYATKIPRGARNGQSLGQTLGVRQELVDAFYMRDGLTITESPLYNEGGYSAVGEDPTGRTETGTRRMFINREPRFYNTVFYNGRKWHIENTQIWFNKNGNSDNSGTFSPLTGHLLYKRTNRLGSYLPGYVNPVDLYQPAIIFRLAEFYLLYAEVLNEVDASDARIIEYVDYIRERAGIPKLATIKPGIIGNQEAQRQAIRAEMRVELATEGQRYFDVNRWMIADKAPGQGGFGGNFYGMDMEAPTLDGFYTRTLVDRKVWRRAMYLYPIPVPEIQKSRLLVQNPLYMAE